MCLFWKIINPAWSIRLSSAAKNFAVMISGVNLELMRKSILNKDHYFSLLNEFEKEHNYIPLVSSPKAILAESEACASTFIIANAVQYVLGKGCIGHGKITLTNHKKTSSLVVILDENNNYYIQLVTSLGVQQ